MRYFILIITLILTVNCNAQLSKEQAIRLAEKVIEDSIGVEFMKQIAFNTVIDYGTSGTWYGINSEELKYLNFQLDDFNDTALHTVNYKALCNNCGITNEILDYRPANFNVSLFLIGAKVYLFKMTNPILIYEINKTYKESKIIASDRALITANKNAPKKSRTTNYLPQLAFYSKSKQFIWIIKRAKGHSTVTEFSIAIDAVNAELIDIKETQIHRGFFKAIGDLFGGVY